MCYSIAGQVNIKAFSCLKLNFDISEYYTWLGQGPQSASQI